MVLSSAAIAAIENLIIRHCLKLTFTPEDLKILQGLIDCASVNVNATILVTKAGTEAYKAGIKANPNLPPDVTEWKLN